MKKIVITCAAAIAALSGNVHAQATPEHELSYNIGVVSDYRFRGVTQTDSKPALQGGIDYSHTPSGFYAGTWASTITWIDDAGGDGNIEIDLYAGKTGEFGNGVSYDFGGLGYIYPGNDFKKIGLSNANTFELYGKLGYGPAYIKYSHAVTDLFGVPDSDGSGYIDVGADIDLPQGFVLNLHAGYQNIARNSGDYTDWKVGVSKEFGIVSASLAVIGTDIKPKTKGTKNRLVLGLTTSF